MMRGKNIKNCKKNKTLKNWQNAKKLFLKIATNHGCNYPEGQLATVLYLCTVVL